jgi:hypothetical protein
MAKIPKKTMNMDELVSVRPPFSPSVGETLAKSQRRFFWQGVSIVRKYFMVK